MLKMLEPDRVEEASIPSCFRPVLELTGHWFICKARSPQVIAEELIRRRCDFFLPVCKELRKEKDQRREIERPLYPQYIFLNGDESRDAVAVHSSRSSWHKSTVWPVAARTQAILGRELIQLAKALEADSFLKTTAGFRKGQAVRITRGAFMGIEGVFDHADEFQRVFLTNCLFGNTVPLEQIPIEHLEAI